MDKNNKYGLISRVEPNQYLDAVPLLPTAVNGTGFSWEKAVLILRKHVGTAIGVALGILLLAAAYVFLLTPKTYSPSARIEVDPPDSGLKTLHEVEVSSPADSVDYLETQVQVLQSETLALGVIRQLHLDRNLEFVTKSEIEKYGNSGAAVKDVKANGYMANSLMAEDTATPLEAIALRAFQKDLKVSSVRTTRLVEISFTTKDAQLSQQIINALIHQFMESNFRRRYASSMEASTWLSSQLTRLRQKVDDSNHAAAEYQQKHGIVESDDRDVPMSQHMTDLTHQLAEAEANRIETEAYVRMVDSGQTDAIPTVRDNPYYQTLLTRYADVRTQLAQAKTIYGDENANVKRLDGEATELATQIEVEKTRMVNRLRTSYAAARDRESMLLSTKDQLKDKMVAAGSFIGTYRTLKEEAASNVALFNTLSSRLDEAGIYAGLKATNIHVIDYAPLLYKATWPKPGLILPVSAILAVLLGLVAAFVKEGFDNTVRTPDDIRVWQGLPTLAMFPTIAGGRGVSAGLMDGLSEKLPFGNGAKEAASQVRVSGLPMPISVSPESAQAEAIRGLRASLLYSRPGIVPRVVLVASPSAGEGKTTVAVNLAKALAQAGRTCLIEADLRRPSIGESLGLDEKVGLSQVLTGDKPLDSVLQRVPGSPELQVITSGKVSENPADLVSSARMAAVAVALRDEFEYVVIDSPPVIAFADARFLASLADIVLMVTRYGCTTRRAIMRAMELFEEVRAPLAGMVLNDIDVTSPDYHYYNYGYGPGTRSYLKHYNGDGGRPPEPPAVYPKENSRGAHA